MKKFISVLLAVIMALAVITVSATNVVTVNPVDVDMLTHTVTITGTGTPNSSFFLLVTNPGKNLTDVESATVQQWAEIVVDENGEYVYKFKLFDPSEGQYKVYAGDGDVKETFKVATESLATDLEEIIISARNNDIDTFKVKVTDPVVMENLAIDKYEPLVSSDISLDMDVYVSKLINAVKHADAQNEIIGTDAQKAAILQSIIKEVAALEVLNQGKATTCSFNADGTFKFDSALKVSEVDAKYGISVHEYYTTGSEVNGVKYTLSSVGKSQVQNALLNKNFSNEEELYSAFIEAVICSGVNKSTQVGEIDYVGYEHISALLTVANNSKAGVKGKISEYIAKNLAGNRTNITSVDTINALIETLSKTETSGNTGGTISGGGGGGATGVTSGGTAVIPEITNPEITANNDKNTTSTYKYKFDDIAKVEWAVEAIEYLYIKGVVNGKANRVFDPNGTVTREEIVKMISIAVGLSEEEAKYK